MVKENMPSALPALNEIKSELIFRSPGTDLGERFGVGFMNKSGRREDFANYRHRNFVVVIILRGSGTYVDENGTEFRLKEGMLFKRFPDTLHSNYIDPDSGWVEAFLEIGHALYQALQAWRVIRTDIAVEPVCLDDGFVNMLWNFKERLRLADETELPLLAGDMFKLVVECRRRSDFMTVSGVEAGLIDEACAFLGRDFSTECDLKKFCRRRGIGYENFRKIFRRKIGVSPWQYRIRRKLDLACARLRDPALSAGEIADELGYSSPYEFSAQFKKYTGVSPAHYRLGCRE
ncbi:MAG: AraC family transcriptional regulator [Victivallaceae bacterium]